MPTTLTATAPERKAKIYDVSVRKTLREIFGIARLRSGQKPVIQNVLRGIDTLAVMPTGSGKSLCYQLPAMHMPGTTLVISPLIALMQDQAEKLQEAGIDIAQINSSQSVREQAEAIDDIVHKRSDIVFATPERLTDPAFMAHLQASKINLFVVDEAHCISQWGHDFRPAYRQLGHAIKVLGQPPVLALTATAIQQVADDIREQLGRPEMQVINTGIYRDNLRYQVVQVTNVQEKMQRLLALIESSAGSGIVYAATVKAVEEIHRHLQEAGASVALYHGRLSAKQRAASQVQFMTGAVRVMVATNAFGMGIDKADLRFVIHYQLPGNLEAYYQESGRAGRDGAPATCTLLYYDDDQRIQKFFLARHLPEVAELQAVWQGLRDLCQEQGKGLPFKELHVVLNSRFGAQEASDSIASIENFEGISKDLSITAGRLKTMLNLLHEAGWVKRDRHLAYRCGKAEPTLDELGRLVALDREKDEHNRQALERMVFYARTAYCRWRVLLDYFKVDDCSETGTIEACGNCDNCLHPVEAGIETIIAPIIVPDLIVVPEEAPQPDPCTVPGTAVEVAKFGRGTVVNADAGQITIAFPDQAQKTFMRDYVRVLP